MQNSYEYDAFGDTTETGSLLNEVAFTGAISDNTTGLYYMNARYYNSDTGRFISQDSYKGSAYEPWTQNLYSYVGNNPVNFIDPTGHWVLAVGFAVMAEGAGLGAGGTIYYAFDDKGNYGIMSVAGGKLGPAPSASGGVNFMWSDADTIYDLVGTSTGDGCSVTAGLMNIGVDANVATSPETGKTYTMIDITIGLGIGSPIEWHGNGEKTTMLWDSESLYGYRSSSPILTNDTMEFLIGSIFSDKSSNQTSTVIPTPAPNPTATPETTPTAKTTTTTPAAKVSTGHKGHNRMGGASKGVGRGATRL